MQIIEKGGASLLGHPQSKDQAEIKSKLANIKFKYKKPGLIAFAVLNQ
jgi:hypothetical protein